MTPCDIYRAHSEHLDDLAALFSDYRTFYRQPVDPDAVLHFLSDRLANDESVIFVARLPGTNGLIGFTQLYPTFSSLQMRRVWTLNDLFVAESARGLGVARALMETVQSFALSTGAVALELATEKTNTAAQKLYDSLGYERIDGYLHYARALDHCD